MPATLDGEPGTIGLRIPSLRAMLARLHGDVAVLSIGAVDKPLQLHTTRRPGRQYHLLPLAIDPAPQWKDRARHRDDDF